MEQVYNENKQDNSVRNLLIILLVVIVGIGSFMLYNTAYKTSPSKATQDNKANPVDVSGEVVVNKVQSWLSNTYHSLTPEARTVVNAAGILLVVRYILWPIFKPKRKNRTLKRDLKEANNRIKELEK